MAGRYARFGQRLHPAIDAGSFGCRRVAQGGERELVTKVTLWLLCAAILLLMVYFVPEPQACFVPPNAPTRGLYDSCWGFWDLWG